MHELRGYERVLVEGKERVGAGDLARPPARSAGRL
jgi:hypothetical protein